MFGIIRTIIKIFFGVIEFLLALRFIFKFFVANTGTPFVAWIYGVTVTLVSPFVGIFPNFRFGGFTVDFATLAALVVYSLVGYLLLQAFSYVGPRHYSN